MINSISKELCKVQIPTYQGAIQMLPFDLSNLQSIPEQFKELVHKMIEKLPIKKGIAYFTIDGKDIKKGFSHRRPGAHIDGNYLPSLSWGSGSGGGNGWKVGEGGRELSSNEHRLSYNSKTGGMLIASTYPACRGWNGNFKGNPGIGGDCSHIKMNNASFVMQPNIVYYGNSQFIHESVPVDVDIYRTLVRVTLPIDYPVID